MFDTELRQLFLEAESHAAENRMKAARNLRNTRAFILESVEESKVYPLNWLLHVRSPEKSFDDSKAINVKPTAMAAEMEPAGYVEIPHDHSRFDDVWSAVLTACIALETRPSNRTSGPDWHNRRFFVPINFATMDEAVSPSEADRLAIEGCAIQITTNRYERNATLRKECIAFIRAECGGRLPCNCCGLDFGEAFGPVGDGFIHIHHLDPLGNRQEPHLVDPKKDLIPRCPNCHAMAHRGKKPGQPPRSPQEIRALKSQKPDG